MARTIFFFVKLAILVAAAVWVANNPGTVAFDWQGWHVETKIGVLLAAVLILMVLAALLYRFWGFIARGPRAMARSREEKRRLKGYRALTQGMVAVAAGDAEEAKRQARIAHGMLSAPPLTLLLAAQAAQLNGDETAAARYFTAMLKNPETAFLGMRGLLNQALTRGDRAEALRLASEAHAERPEAGWAAKALLDLELEEGRWEQARRSARAAAKLKAITPEAARRIEAVTLLAEAQAEREGVRAFGLAKEAAKLLPDFVPAVAIEAKAAFRAGRLRDAEKLIEKAWARGLAHPNLAAIYANLKPDEAPVDRARRFEKLAATKPEAEESRLALAETALAAGLWGQARQALDALLAAGTVGSARLCRLMARLEEGERNDLVAARRWLLQATEAPGDPAWICSRCTAASAEWSARCPRCGGFDTQSWRETMRTAAPALAAAELPRALTPPATSTAAETSATPPAKAPPMVAPSVDAARLIT